MRSFPLFRRVAAVACMLALVVLASAPSLRATGRFREFSLTVKDSWPTAIVAGPDGNLWFNEEADRVGRITPSGGVIEFPVASISRLMDITAGPDGNLWFAKGGWIGRVTPTGTITEFPAYFPGGGGQPMSITSGPDGNLWFGGLTDEIGRITRDGTITRFPVPTDQIYGHCNAHSVVAGPDGNVWFADGRIGRITMAGVVTLFYATHYVQSVTVGADGNLWFTELYGGTVGRITPAGEITEFPLPGSHDLEAGQIAPGPDGNLWFTEHGSKRLKVGRITVDGEVIEQRVPGLWDAVGDVAAGPDGNLWLTDTWRNSIVRLNIAEADTKYALVGDSYFSPAERAVHQGETMQWMFVGPNSHSVTDSSGMGLFDSGVRSFVDYYSFTFLAAGRYPYESAAGSDAMAGTIKVPLEAPPTVIVGAPLTVTWSSAAPPSGYVFDVRVMGPTDATWQDWQTGVSAPGADYTAPAPGTYRFKARLRNATGHSAFSPAWSVEVS